MAIIIQQDAKIYSLFIYVNCSTCFGCISTHHQELITLYLQYLALMRPLLLPVVNVTRLKHVEQFTDINKLYIVAFVG